MTDYPRKWDSETSLVDEDDWNAVCDHIDETKEGTATISAGDTEVTVTHNKGVANYPVVVPSSEPASFWWVPSADVGVNSFKIKLVSPNLESDTTFYYQV